MALMVNNLTGFGAGQKALFALDAVNSVGLSSGLQLCLDAADPRCYNGSSQTWSDSSGNGNDFFLGGSSSVSSADPVFVGTTGALGEDTYFSFDGSQAFSEATAQTWADTWHRDNGLISIVAAVYCPTSGASGGEVFSNFSTSTGVGAALVIINASDKIRFSHTYSNTPQIEQVDSTATLGIGKWNLIGVSFSEPLLTASLLINGTVETSAALASTATSTAGALAIGSSSNFSGVEFLKPGVRIAALMSWTSYIGPTGLANIYSALKPRFPSAP